MMVSEVLVRNLVILFACEILNLSKYFVIKKTFYTTKNDQKLKIKYKYIK